MGILRHPDVVPNNSSMKRRPPSLRRVAVEGRCPGFFGTTRTLRLRSAPSCPAFVSFAGAVPRCIACFAPSGGRCAGRKARTFVVADAPIPPSRYVESRGSLKFSHRPPCRPARVPSTPEEPGGACHVAPSDAAAELGNARGFFDGNLSRLDHTAWRLAVYASQCRVAPTPCKTRFRPRGYALPGDPSHPRGLH